MSGPNQKKPGGKKPGKPNRKPEQPQSPKPEQVLSPKPERPQSPKPERLQSPKPAQLQSPEPEQLPNPAPEPLLSPKPAQPPSPAPAKPPGLELQDSKKQADAAAALSNNPSIDFQTLASAYGNYTKKSFEETKAFVEKLSSARSVDKAVEIQIEFAKQAYETFVAESQKIRALYSGLAKQTLKPYESFVARKPRDTH